MDNFNFLVDVLVFNFEEEAKVPITIGNPFLQTSKGSKSINPINIVLT